MPRLSLYKPEKGLDYKFIDRQASEMFQVGGTDVYLHKYLGPKLNANGTADQPVIDSYNVANIQDLLFLENRDRKYDEEIYRIRGIYNVQNVDFNLSQFGLFIDNDTLYMTVHINDFIKYIGRKPISGDVIELPHLRDEFALNDYDVSLPRYYVIEDVGRASEGFSATWYPHLYRLKIKKITDAQQFADILKLPASADNPTGPTIQDILSTRAKELQINDQVLAQANIDAPKSGYETRQFYTLAVDAKGNPVLETADEDTLDASSTLRASAVNGVPQRSGYTGYLTGDGLPVNGYDFGFGIQFPVSASDNDFFLRTDFLPNRLFRYQDNRWIKVEDNVRMDLSNSDTRSTLKTSFINNNNYTYNQVVATDYVKLVKDQYVIDTVIPYTTALYIVLKLETFKLEYKVADHPTMLGISSGKVRITLPIVASTQQKIPYAGAWALNMYNLREEERSSLSKALKPKADL
jgi:hypothetical protein